ncbi:hypothetical protein LINPERPRIM_LOCUS34091, partial [Linum perenne]
FACKTICEVISLTINVRILTAASPVSEFRNPTSHFRTSNGASSKIDLMITLIVN